MWCSEGSKQWAILKEMAFFFNYIIFKAIIQNPDCRGFLFTLLPDEI
jgi:hypothetical protein